MNNDPLNRPLPEHMLPKQQPSGDLILAGFINRSIACLIDTILVFAIFYGSCFALSKQYGAISSNIVCGGILLIWASYIIIFSIIRGNSTIGQKITKIRLYSLFSDKITFGIALYRFILISYPILIASCVAPSFIAEILLPNKMLHIEGSINENLSNTILLVCTFIELILLFPLLSNNYRNVSWDKTLRLCVIKYKLY
jgi:uncharacterized RDD family membrane protein YckC